MPPNPYLPVLYFQFQFQSHTPTPGFPFQKPGASPISPHFDQPHRDPNPAKEKKRYLSFHFHKPETKRNEPQNEICEKQDDRTKM